MAKLGRNDPCHCGSGKKYKQCHLVKDEAAEREARAKAAAEAPVDTGAAEARAEKTARTAKHQPWKGRTNAHGFQRVTATRKVGS